jgi:recombination protein RecA
MKQPQSGIPHNIYPTISSGSLKIDVSLGTGGYPPGSIVEISGKTSSGKSALALHGLREALHTGRLCAIIDADRSLDVRFAQNIGLDLDRLYYSEPQNTEQALNTLEVLAKTGSFSMIVLDSIPALTPTNWFPEAEPEQLEISNDVLISSCLHRIKRKLSETGTTVIFTNDFKQKMSAVYHHLSRDPRRNTLKLFADIRLRLANQERIIRGGIVIGERFQIRIIKNRYFPLINMTNFDIIYQQGINKSAEVFALGIPTRLIHSSSEGYFYQTIFLGKTSSRAVAFLEGNKQVRADAEENIRRAFLPDNY